MVTTTNSPVQHDRDNARPILLSTSQDSASADERSAIGDYRRLRRRVWLPSVAAAWILALVLPSTIQAEDLEKEGAPVRGSSIVADKNLAGTWNLVRSVNEGEAVPKAQIKGTEVIVRENEISVIDTRDQERYRAVYDFDRSTDPATITMRSTLVPGEEEGSVSLGIYKVEGDTWKLAYALPGQPRPEKLQSTGENQALLMVMKRPKTMRQKTESDTEQ